MKSFSFTFSIIPLLFISSCKHITEKTTPLREDITESVYASGTIKSTNQYQVYSPVNGLLVDLKVDEGDTVEKGQVIAVLDNKTQTLSSENAILAAKNASFQQNNERLRSLQASIDLAKTKLDQDAQLLQRQQQLWQQNIGTRNELEQRQLAYQNSSTALQTTQLQYAQLKKDISMQSAQADKNVQIASSVRNQYLVHSQVTGRVYAVNVKQGEMVSAVQPIAIIGDANNFEIELEVDEYDIGTISKGQRIILAMDSYPDSTFEAIVSSINPIMNERSRTFTVKAGFTKVPPKLYPNLTCEANIIIAEKKNVLTIPRAFLLAGDSVLVGNKEKKKVQTGCKDYQKVEIVSGLSSNDIILKPSL